jgi:hypothetical protein
MAKKRPSYTQKLQDEIQKLQNDVKVFQAACEKKDELLNQMRENGESSFLNSPTYIQMKEKIAQLKSQANLSELGRISAKGSARREADLEDKILADNKAFLEHEGDTDYFIGITECIKDLKEIDIIKSKLSEAEGRIDGYKAIISERDAEIDRLQSVVAELKHSQSAGTTLPETQCECNTAIQDKAHYKKLYEEECKLFDSVQEKITELLKENKDLKLQLLSNDKSITLQNDRIRYENAISNEAAYYQMYLLLENEKRECLRENSELRERIEELELRMSEAPKTDNISDEELENLSIEEIRSKCSETINGTSDRHTQWYDYYNGKNRTELVRSIKYVETVSERRKKTIDKLQKQLKDKKFAQYSQDDAVTYSALIRELDQLKHDLKLYQKFYDDEQKRNDELQAKIAEMAAATLSKEEAIKAVEANIAQDTEMKKATRKKKGRPQTMTTEQIALIHVLREQGHSIRQIAKQLGKSEGTIHRYIHEKQG